VVWVGGNFGSRTIRWGRGVANYGFLGEGWVCGFGLVVVGVVVVFAVVGVFANFAGIADPSFVVVAK